MAEVRYLERPVFGMSEVDALLGLNNGTARRWIDGYDRSGKHYAPVVREETTGVDIATWGEFVETRFLADFRDRGVRMLQLRPVFEGLRQRLGVRYPFAHVKPWVDPNTRRVVYDLQRETGVEEDLRVVVEAGRGQLMFTPFAQYFFSHEAGRARIDGDEIIATIHPLGLERAVTIDPTRRFGQPTVRAIPTDVLAEQWRAGDPVEAIAEAYDLTLDQVMDAIEYERRRQQQKAAS